MIKVRCFFVFCIALCVSACGQERATVRTANDYVKSVAVYAKPGASISLSDQQVNLGVSGVQYAINIDLNSAYDSGQLTLSVAASDGLYIVGGDVAPVIALGSGIISLPYTVIAAEEGRYYIYLNVSVEKGGVVTGRALTFIVQVGDESKSISAAAQKSSANTSGVVSMPAKEVIIP